MSASAPILLHAALVAIGLAITAAIYGACTVGSPVRARLGGYERRLSQDLSFIGAPFDGTTVIGLQAIALLGIAALSVTSRTFVALAAVVPVAVGPLFAILHRRAVRKRDIEAQLDGWLTTMASTLMATASLGEALSSSVRLLQSPLREEIERVVAHTGLGMPLDRALGTFAERVRSPVVSGALLCLRVARNAGGELRPMLESAAAALRDMARFEGTVRAKTAEGRAQALAVSVVPAPLVLAVRTLSPEYFLPLSQSAAGLLIVAGATLLWVGAIALAAKIAAVEV